MTANNYRIKIHISRNNTIRGTFKGIPYKNSRPEVGDTVTFKCQTVLIEAIRSKKMSVQEVLFNEQNSLYRQIIKCILFLYLKNNCWVKLNKIEILRFTKSTRDLPYSIEIDKYNQPIKANFSLRYTIPDSVLDFIWKESVEGEFLRTISSHWLSALASEYRLYIFEQLWRTFEQLAFYANRTSHSNTEFDAIKNMKAYIWNHVDSFPEAINDARRISGKNFRDFDWKGYVQNEFPTLAISNKSKPYTEKFQNNFVLCNRDLRVVNMLEKILSLRSAELMKFGVYDNVNNHINTLLLLKETHDEQLLTMLCCKYAYYFRNKMFHGEVLSHSFTFSDKTVENKRVDILNTLLQSLTTDLILIFDSL